MGYDRKDPIIVISNQSTLVRDIDLNVMIVALQRQIDRDFAPTWGLTAHLVFNQQIARAMQVIIKDVSDEAGDLGYHFINGLPITYVFAKDDMANGAGLDGLSTTLSHELLEMLADPGVNIYSQGFYFDKGGRRHPAFVSYEVCDAVEEASYDIGGVKVSDFVMPEWFEPEHKPGEMKMSFCGEIDSPFQLAQGGYIDVIANGRIKTLWGQSAKRKALRHRLTARMGKLS
jgi:hypothetical protein